MANAITSYKLNVLLNRKPDKMNKKILLLLLLTNPFCFAGKKKENRKSQTVLLAPKIIQTLKTRVPCSEIDETKIKSFLQENHSDLDTNNDCHDWVKLRSCFLFLKATKDSKEHEYTRHLLLLLITRMFPQKHPLQVLQVLENGINIMLPDGEAIPPKIFINPSILEIIGRSVHTINEIFINTYLKFKQERLLDLFINNILQKPYQIHSALSLLTKLETLHKNLRDTQTQEIPQIKKVLAFVEQEEEPLSEKLPNKTERNPTEEPFANSAAEATASQTIKTNPLVTTMTVETIPSPQEPKDDVSEMFNKLIKAESRWYGIPLVENPKEKTSYYLIDKAQTFSKIQAWFNLISKIENPMINTFVKIMFSLLETELKQPAKQSRDACGLSTLSNYDSLQISLKSANTHFLTQQDPETEFSIPPSMIHIIGNQLIFRDLTIDYLVSLTIFNTVLEKYKKLSPRERMVLLRSAIVLPISNNVDHDRAELIESLYTIMIELEKPINFEVLS